MTFAQDKRFAHGEDHEPGKQTRVAPPRDRPAAARVPGRRTLVEQQPAVGAKVDAFVQHSTQLRTAHEHHVGAAIAQPHAHAPAPAHHAPLAPHRSAPAAQHAAPAHQARHTPPSTTTATATKGAIALKKIDDWNKFVPQLPNSDAREHGKILKLVQARINASRTRAAHALEHMRSEQLQIAAQLHTRLPALEAEVEHARERALGEVAAAEAAQAASIQAHSAGVIAHVRASATATKAHVTAAHARTVAEIDRSLQQSTQQLAREHQQAIQQSHADEAAQVAVVAAKFSATTTKIVALGGEKAGQASGLGSSTPLPYTGKKLSAARKAAQQVAQQYAAAMPGQASKAASQLGSHQADVDTAVHKIANQVRQHIDAAFQRATKLLQSAHTQTLGLAERTKASALRQIDQTAASSVAQVGSSASSQAAAVRSQGAAARMQVVQSAASSVASLHQACSSASTEFDDSAHKLTQAASQLEVPNATALEQKGNAAIGELHGKQQAVLAGLSQQAAQASSGIASIGSSTVQSMAHAAAQANTTTTAVGAGASQQLAQAAQHVEQALSQIGHSFTTQATQISTSSEQSFRKLTTGEANEYKQQAAKLQSGLQTAYSSIQHSFDQAVPHKEVVDILKQAAAAAAKVKTGWSAFFSDVLKVVEVVVIVVVAVAIVALVSVLTDGLGDVLLGEGMAWMVDGLADAVAGGLSNMAQTILQNVWLNHQGWSGGMFTALWEGAAAGAASAAFAKGGELLVASKLGGKIGLGGFKDALEGGKGWSNVWRRGAFDLTVGSIGSTFQQLVIEGEAWNGQWSSSEFWLNLATNAATVGATSHGKFDEITEGTQKGLYGKKLEAGKHAGEPHAAKDPSYQGKHEAGGAAPTDEVAKGLADAGYPNAQKANADRAASAVESGEAPAAGDLRDTAANDHGVAQLHAVLSDPSLTPLEKVRIGARLAQTLRSKPPTGTFDGDVDAAAHGST